MCGQGETAPLFMNAAFTMAVKGVRQDTKTIAFEPMPEAAGKYLRGFGTGLSCVYNVSHDANGFPIQADFLFRMVRQDV